MEGGQVRMQYATELIGCDFRNLAVHERTLRELTMDKTPWILGEEQQAASTLSNTS
jgi:hypothetical protein